MACIFAGRNLIGKANEAVASLPIGEQVLQHLYGTRIRNALMARGVVRIGLEKRVGLALERAHRVLSSVQALVTLSSFGRTFFGQLGVPNERMHVLPWYYDPPALPPAQSASKAGELVVGYIGRLSPEKGVHVLLEAISIVQSTQPLRLLIAGAVDNQYATALHRRYPDRIGKHAVEWLGWMPHAEIARFFNQVDIVAMPSLGMDNTPGTLLESYSFRCPVIATDLPSLRDLVQDGVNGFLFPLGDTQALSQAIRRIAAAPDIIPQLSRNIPNVLSSGEYTAKLAEIYREIA
jgi:glycosyltransferase involved in cell wall biosynthesis